MQIGWAVAVAGAALLMWSVPAPAHHSFATQYDARKPVEMKGAITKVEWANPHARFYMEYICEENNQDVKFIEGPAAPGAR